MAKSQRCAILGKMSETVQKIKNKKNPAAYLRLMHLYMYLAYVIINILVVLASNLFLTPECTTAGGRAEASENHVG